MYVTNKTIPKDQDMKMANKLKMYKMSRVRRCPFFTQNIISAVTDTGFQVASIAQVFFVFKARLNKASVMCRLPLVTMWRQTAQTKKEVAPLIFIIAYLYSNSLSNIA